MTKQLDGNKTSNASKLFRSEVYAASSNQLLGSLRLARPASSWLICGVAGAITGLLIAYVSFASVTKKARVTGVVVPAAGSVSIISPNSGTLIKAELEDGDIVKAGQVLFTVVAARQTDQGELSSLIAKQHRARDDTLSGESLLRRRLHLERKSALEQKMLNATAEAEQFDQEIGLAERRVRLAQQSMEKYAVLLKSGFVAESHAQQKQEEVIDATARLAVLQRNRTQLLSNRSSLRADLEGLAGTLAAELVQIDRASALLKQEMAENSSRQSNSILAPVNGRISAITHQTGAAVTPGQVLATVIPHVGKVPSEKSNALEVHLYVPSRTIGFVAPGQKVLIRYAAFPYQKFGLQEGRVMSISGSPYAPNTLPQFLASTVLSNAQQGAPGSNGSESLYRIKVGLVSQSIAVYSGRKQIVPGMTLEADIVQDRRRVWEWILEPLLAVSQIAS